MMPSSSTKNTVFQMITILALLSILASFADAFQTSARVAPPVIVPLDLPTEGKISFSPVHPNEASEFVAKIVSVEKVSISRRKLKYDLGLGKNKPVTNKRTEETPSINKAFDPTRFLIEHESVRSYPSPLDLGSESQSRNKNRTKNKRKILPKVQHKRHSEDVLYIRDCDYVINGKDNCKDDSFCHPIIVPINHFYVGSNIPATKLDVNTVWVEMMLHNEQKKLRTTVSDKFLIRTNESRTMSM